MSKQGKRMYSTIVMLLITTWTFAQNGTFTIEGTMKNKNSGIIYLGYGGEKPDSTAIKDGRFIFTGKLDVPAMAVLMMDKNARGFDKYARVYIVPAKMKLTLDYDNFEKSAALQGSSVQDEFVSLEREKADIYNLLEPYSKAYDKANLIYIDAIKAKKDEATLDSLKSIAHNAREALMPYHEQLGDLDTKFMDNHPASFVTASILRFRIGGMPLQEGEARYSRLSSEVKNSSMGKEIKQELDALKMGSPGAKAFVFSSTELRGEPLSLADYRGKYVLVDFWASWCVPCRAGNPHLLSLYSKYKDKGFEIIGVSDDDNNREAWQKAVEKDGIGVWKHVLRGLQYDGTTFDRSKDISDQYGIQSLPTKILIDPQGVIIGRYGGGGENDEAMDKKLAEIFGS